MTSNLRRKSCHKRSVEFALWVWVKLLVLWFLRLWDRLRGRDRVSSEALEWVIALHSRASRGATLPEFRTWLDQSDPNRDRFNELWDLWLQLGELKDARRWRQPPFSQHPAAQGGQKKRIRRRLAVALAVVAVLGLVFIYLSPSLMDRLDKNTARSATQQPLATGVHGTAAGETAQLKTVDGSTISLSELTQVRLNFRTGRRQVELDRGEARFDVAKDTQTPFEVSVDDGAIIRAVGTKFRVKKTGAGSARVVVDEGEVDLLVDNQQTLRVKAGQSAEFEKRLIRLTEGFPVGGVTETSSPPQVWLIFRDEPLEDAVRVFNRYNPKQRIVVEQSPAQRGVQGRFLATNPQGFAGVLSVARGMKCSISRDANSGLETIHLSVMGARSPPHSPRTHVC